MVGSGLRSTCAAFALGDRVGGGVFPAASSCNYPPNNVTVLSLTQPVDNRLGSWWNRVYGSASDTTHSWFADFVIRSTCGLV